MITEIEKEIEKAFVLFCKRRGLKLKFESHPDDIKQLPQKPQTPDSLYSSRLDYYQIEHTQIIEEKDMARRKEIEKLLREVFKGIVPPLGNYNLYLNDNFREPLTVLKEIIKAGSLSKLMKKAAKLNQFGTISDKLITITKLADNKQSSVLSGPSISSIPSDTLNLEKVLKKKYAKFRWRLGAKGILIIYANNANKGPGLIKKMFDEINLSRYPNISFITIVVNYPHSDSPIKIGEKVKKFVFINILDHLFDS